MTPSIEPLESRIAPAALYFVQSSSLEVHKADGTSAQDSPQETNANAFAGSTAAVLLQKGDSLIFDADGSNTLTDGDTVLATVKAGQAMVFLTELDSSASFSKNEITGLALSNGFSGSIFTDVNGSIVTSLDSKGDISENEGGLVVGESSVASLHVTGQIDGSVLVGKNLNDLAVDGKLVNTGDQFSVSGTIATGTATNGKTISFNGDGTSRSVEYHQVTGASGGNISKVSLDFGASSIVTGNGSNVSKGKAGAGGSITGVTVGESTLSLTMETGFGGNVTSGAGTGGAGGSITKSTISTHSTTNDSVRYVAGSGGNSSNGAGGVGGAISDLSVTVLDTTESFSVIAGLGGMGGTKGAGGAGGALSKITVSTQGISDGDLDIEAGNGGGSGGTGGKGGAGGAVKTVSVTTQGTLIDGNINVKAGEGGDGVGGGGAGGLLMGATATLGAQVTSVNIAAGGGGESGHTVQAGFATLVAAPKLAAAAGGAGGALTKVMVSGSATIDSLTVAAGDSGSGQQSAGKTGGLVKDVQITTSGAVQAVTVHSGNGGSILGAGNAGAGGALSGVTYNNKGGVQTLSIFSGLGGSVNSETENGIFAKGNAGQGGTVSGVIINNYADVSGSASIASSVGGTISGESGNKGNAGSSGAISKVVINDFNEGATTGAFNIYAGVGKFGSGAGDGAKGANVGSIKDITLNAPSSHVVIGNPVTAGSSGAGKSAVAGSGGLITDIHGAVGVLDIIAANGGSSPGGKGGAGGSISKVNVTTTGANHFIHLLAAGNGGSGSTAKTSGAGGSVSGIVTTGNIGDFTKAFGLSTDAASQGGISAGLSGNLSLLNGSVTDITAAGIATIIAGRPSATGISSASGVGALTKIKTGVLGANTGIAGDHQEYNAHEDSFDYNDNNNDNVFEPAFDEAIDGVIVVAGTVAPTLPVVPLKLLLAGNILGPEDF